MRTTLLSIAALLPLLLSACKSTGAGTMCADHQAIVEAVAKEHADVARLSIHCMSSGSPMACASTSADKRGKPSDPEDVQAIQTGKQVVKDEGANLDVTVPICEQDGKYMAACGITLKNAGGMTRDQLIAEANTIAKAVETQMGKCSGSCSSGSCCSGGSCTAPGN